MVYWLRMEGVEFLKYFEKVPHLMPHFLGVFPIDKMPKSMKSKTFFVCNLDPSWKGGSHWIAFFKTNNKECEIFDSLGTNVDVLKPHLNFKNKMDFVYNETSFQTPSSTLCGKFVIMFCVERLLNPDLEMYDLLEEIFDSDLNKNDSIVTNFCENLLI